jgi:hypothetical protein
MRCCICIWLDIYRNSLTASQTHTRAWWDAGSESWPLVRYTSFTLGFFLSVSGFPACINQYSCYYNISWLWALGFLLSILFRVAKFLHVSSHEVFCIDNCTKVAKLEVFLSPWISLWEIHKEKFTSQGGGNCAVCGSTSHSELMNGFYMWYVMYSSPMCAHHYASLDLFLTP